MLKRIAPLMFLAAWFPAAWTPQAQAFPPCPVDPMDYGTPTDAPATPWSATTSDRTQPWFKAYYHFVGDPIIIDRLKPERAIDITIDPNTGKCRDRDGLPLLNPHASAGMLQLDPRYAPRSGFGVIALPDLPTVALDGLTVAYRLDFTVDSGLLRKTTDWLDVAQLDFFRNDSAGMKYTDAVSSIYRVRKTQRDAGHAAIEIIESRAAPTDIASRPPFLDRVVAVIPLAADQSTAIGLRWTQTAKSGAGSSLVYDHYDIDAVFDVLGPNDEVLYTTPLPGQWASLMSMGLLDYNVTNASAYDKTNGIEFSDMQLSAERKY